MNYLMKHIKQLPDNKFIFILVLFSALIASRIMYIQHGWVNDDSTLYFEMAKRFSAGQWRQGWELFQWPFYPLLIAALHKLLSIDLLLSAQILAVAFYAITTLSLCKLIQLAGGNKRAILCGALLLVSSTYITGDILAMLLRDQGFWAFFLASLVFFVRYMRHYKMADALLWQISIITATLFRIEGIAYAFFMPFMLLMQANAWQTNFKHLVKANLLHLSSAALLLIAALLTHSLNTEHMGRLNEIRELFSGSGPRSMFGYFNIQAGIFARDVLGVFLDGYARAGLFITLLLIVAMKCLKVAGSLVTVLMLAARKDLFTLPQRDVQNILLAASSVAILNASVNIFRSFILSSRYVIAFGFIAIIFISFYLASLFSKWQGRQHISRWQQALLIFSVIAISLGLVKNIAGKRDDYNFEQQAVAWVKQHAPADAHIRYGSGRLRYFADAPWEGREEDTMDSIQSFAVKTQQYDCLVMRVQPDESQKLAQLKALPGYQEVKSFSNRSGTQAMVFCRKGLN